MTTIVFKDSVIAYDSRSTNGTTITSDNANKKIVINKVIFILSGYIGDFEILTSAYFDADFQEEIESDGPVALVVDEGKVFLCSIDTDTKKFWKQPLAGFEHYAIGSGSLYALGAIAMGADAVKAVKVAASLDVHTGGKIHTVKIKPLPE